MRKEGTMDEVNTVGAMGDPSDDPVLGSDGYPHTIEIARIKTWPVQSMADLRGLLEYVRRRWKYDDMMWAESDETDDMLGGRRYREYRMSTGGWSGNEDLVGALEENTIFAMIAPWSWQRGGHYVYRVPYDPS